MSNALYYPTIEFQDIDALKRSLLLWNRVFRITPPSYVPIDNAEVITATQAGAIVNLTVNEKEKSDTARRFLDFYAQRNDMRSRLVWPAGFSTQEFTPINVEKIDAKLLPLFESLSRRLTAEGFHEVPQEIAGGYMFHLATEIAKARSLSLITDSSDYWAVGTFFAQNGNFDEKIYDDQSNAYLANLAIDDLLPNDLRGVSIEKILRFNEDNFEQKEDFQRKLLMLQGEISRCNNKEHARYIVSDFVKRFERAKEEYKKSLKFFGKGDVCSIFSVGVATTATIFSLPLPPGYEPYTPLHLGAGLLIGAVASLATRELTKKERTVASYLVDAERLTRTPSGLLHRKFEEFIND
jgi:hypothetical protein